MNLFINVSLNFKVHQQQLTTVKPKNTNLLKNNLYLGIEWQKTNYISLLLLVYTVKVLRLEPSIKEDD